MISPPFQESCLYKQRTSRTQTFQQIPHTPRTKYHTIDHSKLCTSKVRSLEVTLQLALRTSMQPTCQNTLCSSAWSSANSISVESLLSHCGGKPHHSWIDRGL